MPINENVIIISSDSDDTDIEELRKLAINSMIKEEKGDSYLSETCDENYKDPVNYQINVYSSFLTRKRSSSIISNEDSKRPKIEEAEADSVENIIKDGLLEVFDINNVLNYSKTDNSFNLLKEEELKNKLLKALRNKKDLNQSNNVILPISNSVTDISYEEPLYESDDNFDIYTHAILPEVITDPNVLKYHNLITEAKLSIEEVVKLINTISGSIQEKLIKSKKITTQIENLKIQKTELHREISVNRRKVLDLHKIKKQKSTELINYELLKRKYAENQLSSVIRNVEFIDSISTGSSDSKPSYYDIDCNHLICPAWLTNICTNKSCIYQHPKLKFSSKPMRNPACKIKENDKVFLKEMNSSGFICKVKCEACSINIFMSNSHIKEDSYCKSCCQQLVTLKNPIDILNQLTLIWHHFYKRYIKSKNLPFDNRDSSILPNLYKCTEAMRAKLTTVVNLPWKLFISTGYHIILTFDYHDDKESDDDVDETKKIDDLIAFLKSVDYNFQFVLFVCKRVSSFPIGKLYQLLIDTMFHLINNSSSIMSISHSGIPLILEEFSICGRNNNLGTTRTIYLDQLFQWLQLSIELSNQIIIDCLVIAILREIIGPEFVPQITLSMHELGFGDKFWQDRKETINRIANLFPFLQSSSSSSSTSSSSSSWPVDNRFCPVLLIKYVILTNFFTGNEEDALNLCRNVIDRGGYFFVILNSKLSLNYNSPFNNSLFNDKLALIEYTFNKSLWLVVNRSVKSSVKLLETVPHILYQLSKPIENPQQSLDLYQSFLEIRPIPPPPVAAAVSISASATRIIDNQNKSTSNLSESEIKLIRNQSAVWLCYINLALLLATNHEDRRVVLDQILESDRIITYMNPEHLNRVAQFIIMQFGKMCGITRCSATGSTCPTTTAGAAAGGQYLSNLRRVFLLLFLDNNNNNNNRSLQFGHFLDAFQAIEFDKLTNDVEEEQQEDYQLQTWLFLIDFCIERFPQDSFDQFLVIISQRLAQTGASRHRHHHHSDRDRQVLRHIIMCYPIRCVEVWVNYIELLLDLAGVRAGAGAGVPCVPVYELIDACNTGVSQFPRSRLLWQYYYDSAVRCADEELLRKIRGNAVKLGFELSQR